MQEAGDRTPVWLAEVTAVAAHDLGNSITALTFAVDLLRERQRTPDEEREIDELRAIIATASTIVRLIARLASQRTPTVRIDLREVLAEAVPLLDRLTERGLESALPDAPAPVLAARSEVERALVEMILAAHARGAPTRLALERTVAAFRIVVEGAPPGTAGSSDLPPLPHARALAAESRGALTARRLASGALRIELSLPAAPGAAA